MRERPLLWSHGIAGAIGSAVLAIGALGLGWLPPLFNVESSPVVGLLHTTSLGEGISRVAVLVGGALLLQSWLLLGAGILGRTAVPLRSLRNVLALWILPTVLVPPLFSRDPYSYFVQGRLLQMGLDPYTHGAASVPGWFRAGVDPMWAETPTPYGPLYLLLQHAVVNIAGTPYWSAIGFRLIAILGIGMMAHYVPKLAQLHGIDPAAATWLAVMNPLVLLHFSLGGHNDALMVGLMLAGLYHAMRRHPVPTVLLLAAAVAVKPIALLVVPFASLLFLRRDAHAWRRWLAYATSGVLVLSLVLIVGLATGVRWGWIQALTTPGSVRTWLSPSTAIGMAIGLVGDAFGNRGLDAVAVTSVRLAFMAVAIAICAWLLLRPQGRSPVRGALLAFTVVIALGPVVQPWYLLWALPLVAVSGMNRSWHLKATVLGTAGFVIYALAEPAATSDPHLDLFDSLGIVMAVATVLLVLLASPRERELAIGNQFAHGLSPLDDDARRVAKGLVVRSVPTPGSDTP